MPSADVQSRATSYFRATVLPTVADFERNPWSIRHAQQSAVALLHVTDHFVHDSSRSDDQTKWDARVRAMNQDIAAACPAFVLVRDVANAAKHAELTRNQSPPRVLTSSNQISATPGMFQAPFGEAHFAEAVRTFATLDDNTEQPILPAIQSLVRFWTAKLGIANEA